MNNTNSPLIDLINELPNLESPRTRENRLLSNRIFRAVDSLIQRNNNIVNERDYDLNNPLHFAVFKGNNVIMRLLLQNGADVNAQNVRGDTPLHWAVFPPGNLAAVNTLLEFNADTTIRNTQNATVFDIAENITSREENINIEEYEDIIDALQNHVVRPRTQRVQEYHPEFAESEFLRYYSSGDECYICYEQLADGSQVCVNTNEKCRHGFHCRCIRPWLQSGNTLCPVCKQAFTLQPLGEMQQRALQNSFGKKRNNNNNNNNKVLLLKGWVFGIQNLEKWRKKSVSVLVNLIKIHKINIIAWDGDLLQQDSFTSVIPEILLKLPKKKIIKLVIFKKKSSEGDDYKKYMDNFKFDKYTNIKNTKNIEIIPIDQSKIVNDQGKTDYYKLGLEGYKYIKTNLNNKIFVARLGLGDIAKREFETVKKNETNEYPNLSIIDIPTVRLSKDNILEKFEKIILNKKNKVSLLKLLTFRKYLEGI